MAGAGLLNMSSSSLSHDGGGGMGDLSDVPSHEPSTSSLMLPAPAPQRPSRNVLRANPLAANTAGSRLPNGPVKSALVDLGGGDSSLMSSGTAHGESELDLEGSFAARQMGGEAGIARRGEATGDGDKNGRLTLREQEKVLDTLKRENFSLKLKIYFLEERLGTLTPEATENALKENIELKVEFQTLRQELKKYKKLLLEAHRVIKDLEGGERPGTRASDRSGAATPTPGDRGPTWDELEDERNLRLQAEDEVLFLRAELERQRNAVNSDDGRDAPSVADMDESRDEATKRALEVEAVEREMEELRADHEREVAEWEEELRMAQDTEAELKDLIAAREEELEDLERENARLVDEIGSKEGAIREMEEELTDQAADIKKLGEDIFHLEDTLEAKELSLARVGDDLARAEQERRAATDRADQAAEKAREDEGRWSRLLEAKNRELQSLREAEDNANHALRAAQAEVDALQARLQAREKALATLQAHVENLEKNSGSRETGMARELERLRREADALRREGERSEKDARDVRMELAEFKQDRRDHDSRLAEQTERGLKLSEKLDKVEKELSSTRVKLEQAQYKISSPTLSGPGSPTMPLSPRTGSGSNESLVRMSARCTTAERRLAATQAQLADAEMKLGQAREKVSVAEGKWEARLRELERRLREAEEKVQRERKGAKERVRELEAQVGLMNGQVKGAESRKERLEEVLRMAGAVDVLGESTGPKGERHRP